MTFISSAAVAAAGKTVFDYNRENFQEDREQRMKKEFAERKYRVKQAELWREDVRDFISLTERKMSIYLLVNVLLLGFNLNLWCEGRLPVGTPDWLMMGNQVAIASSFTFLLLTVWLAMHASVAAQSYRTRILTQLVRLPLPTWEELDACRTHGSEFEKVEPRQMFRVPFLTGRQEDITRRSASSAVRGEVRAQRDQSSEEFDVALADDVVESADAGEELLPAADPWGLEQRSDDFLELGCHYGEEVACLRHIKLVRQAAVYYQTYDAFARVSMSVGVNQLMLAMSYYILGYAMTQVQAPVAAIAGVIILMGSAELIARIDLTLPVWDHRLIQVLLVFGPAVACLATYYYVQQQDVMTKIAECLAPVAFISHGVVVGLMTLVLSVREQENGAMLPLAFQGVLYLDVFGWVSHKQARSKLDVETPLPRPISRSLTFAKLASASLQESEPGPRRHSSVGRGLPGNVSRLGAGKGVGKMSPVAAEEAPLSRFAKDYQHEPVCGSAHDEEDEGSDDEGGDNPYDDGFRVARPAASAVSYDEVGRPLPMRPADMAPSWAASDMRHVDGAPRAWEHVNAREPAAKEFWDPVTFMPPENRRRKKMDSLIADTSEKHFEGQERASLWGFRPSGEDEDVPMATGHDNEMPGVLPWRVFRNAALVISLVWILAGVYSILHITHIWSMALPWWWEVEHAEGESTGSAGLPGVSALQWGGQVVPDPGVLSLIAAGVTMGEVSPLAERVTVEWPYTDIQPRTLSCDASGHRFLVTDGLSAFEADLTGTGGSVRAQEGGSAQFAQTQLAPEVGVSVMFRQTPRCPALLGEGVEDAALACVRRSAESSPECEALVLHRDGRRLAACPLAGGEATNDVANISLSWLDGPNKGLHGGRKEKAKWLIVDQACTAGASGTAMDGLRHGCVSLGTTHGRVAQMTRHHAGHELVPLSIVEDHSVEHVPGDPTRLLGGRYLGVLQSRRQSIRVLDGESAAEAAGLLLLPSTGRVGDFCVGGGHVYLMEKGQSPLLWRFPLPGSLRSDGAEEEEERALLGEGPDRPAF